MREKPDVHVFAHLNAQRAASRVARRNGGSHSGDRGLWLGGIKPAGHDTEPEPDTEPERIELPRAGGAVLVSRARARLAPRRQLIRPCIGARRTVGRALRGRALRGRVAGGLPYRDSCDQH
jgi:hypothetical protein